MKSKEEFSLKIIIDAIIKEHGTKFLLSVPSNQPKLDVKSTISVLTSVISMLIKSSNNTNLGIKDYELMEFVIDELQNDFKSTKNFDDASADTSIIEQIK